MQITYSNKFEKQYRKLPDSVKDQAETRQETFIQDPFHPSLKTHKLHGELKAYYAFSINSKYRIIFSFDDNKDVRFHYVGKHDIYG
jgi:addiction module RelE/StbE family toxin